MSINESSVFLTDGSDGEYALYKVRYTPSSIMSEKEFETLSNPRAIRKLEEKLSDAVEFNVMINVDSYVGEESVIHDVHISMWEEEYPPWPGDIGSRAWAFYKIMDYFNFPKHPPTLDTSLYEEFDSEIKAYKAAKKAARKDKKARRKAAIAKCKADREELEKLRSFVESYCVITIKLKEKTPVMERLRVIKSNLGDEYVDEIAYIHQVDNLTYEVIASIAGAAKLEGFLHCEVVSAVCLRDSVNPENELCPI